MILQKNELAYTICRKIKNAQYNYTHKRYIASPRKVVQRIAGATCLSRCSVTECIKQSCCGLPDWEELLPISTYGPSFFAANILCSTSKPNTILRTYLVWYWMKCIVAYCTGWLLVFARGLLCIITLDGGIPTDSVVICEILIKITIVIYTSELHLNDCI